ncbi:MAG: cytochrome 450, partial [Cyanobacteria bacterium P01_F01_bin.3]
MNLSFDNGLSISLTTLVSGMAGVIILGLTSARLVRAKSENTASTFERLLNGFQIWALQHPNAVSSRLVLPLIGVTEGVMANFPTYLDAKRMAFGSSFCCAGQVVIGDFNALKTALTSPQARTWRLGTSPLDAHFSPNLDVGG